MTRGLYTMATVGLALVCWSGAARAQVTETPAAFDSAGKIRTLTPALLTRLRVTAPVWPATTEFREARLYTVSSGGTVLVVERLSGSMDRYPLDAGATNAMRSAIDAGVAVAGRIVTEERADVFVENAGGAFVRRQMALTWGLYAPLLVSMTDDEQTGSAAVLLATGASFFIATGISRTQVISRTQNRLSTDGALRGAATAAGAMYALAGDNLSRHGFSATALAGALAGTIGGFQLGRRLTDSEAEASTDVSTYAALTALGVGGATGLLTDGDEGRALTGAIVGSGVAGYLVGPRYARQSSYNVTRGDIHTLGTGATLGFMTAISLMDYDIDSERPFFRSATIGMLGGLAAAHYLWVKPFDHSTGDAAQVNLGMTAGALIGLGLVTSTEPGAREGLIMVTTGGILGALAGRALADPPRAGARLSNAERRSGRFSVRMPLEAVALSAARVPGQHALVSFRF